LSPDEQQESSIWRELIAIERPLLSLTNILIGKVKKKVRLFTDDALIPVEQR
jgi:hypothetical protein